MSNFKGKRMVSEDLIKKLEDLDPSGGAEYTAGEGIEISDENEISIDTDTVATKDELFSGDYDDLTNKPTNLVTTDTQQDITGQKTFITSISTPLEIKGSSGSNATIRFKGENDFTGPMIYGSYGLGLHLKPRNISDFQIEDNSSDHKFKLPSKANGTYTLATSDDIPAAVSGTNDGTNWTGLTIGSDTYAIPAGGGSSYTFTDGLTESSGTVSSDLYSALRKHSNGGLIGGNSTWLSNANASNGCLVFGSASNSFGLQCSALNAGSIVFGYGSNSYNQFRGGGFGSITGGCLEGGATTVGQAGKGSIVFGYLGNSGEFLDGNNKTGAQIFGRDNKAGSDYQMVIGKFNDSTNTSNAAFVIGNGSSHSSKSNAMTVDWDGTIVSKNLPAVSGTDGTYQLTATTSSGTTTYSWATGGSGGKYLHKIKIYANFSSARMFWTEDFISSSATPYTSVSDYLNDRGYTITDLDEQPTKSLDTYSGTAITALAFRDTYGLYTTDISINSNGVASYNRWSLQSNTPTIQDEVIAL